MTAVGDGTLPVLPHLALPVVDAERAFRLFARAEHIGKVVVGFDQADTIAVMPDDQAPLLRSDGAYLVTGGFGGLGLTLAPWLAKQGAGRIVLTGRRDPGPAARDAIAALVASGLDLDCRMVDVGDATAMEKLFTELATARLPLRGIFHLAAAGDDGLLTDLTWPRFETALLPKVQGTRQLDRLSRSFDLDHFVLFSSTASVLGAAGQANYAAGNAFLDAVAAERRASGLPALSIAWGPWASIGGAAERGLATRFENRGLASLPPETALAALKRLLLADARDIMVASFDGKRWAEFYPSAASLVGAGDERTVDVSLVERLGALDSKHRAALLSEYLRGEVATVLGVPVARIDPERTAISQSGLDSLMALELRARLEAGLGLKLSATLVWNYPSLPALAEYLMLRLGFGMARAEAELPAMTAITDAPLDLEAMSEEAAEAMLVERLNELTISR
jgi:acyl carrier protein/short-subunit dehydrogenase